MMNVLHGVEAEKSAGSPSTTFSTRRRSSAGFTRVVNFAAVHPRWARLCATAKSTAGFTLIEILVVIGIIAVLAAVVLIAINPARQFAQANNSQRSSNVNAILNAIGQYMADNRGGLPAGIATTTQNISDTGADICADLVPDYMPALPVDPDAGDEAIDDCSAAYDTEYTVVQATTTQRITVSAPNTTLCSADPCPSGEVIQVTR